QLCQFALGFLRVLVIKPFGDTQSEDRVAEEFEPLIGRQPTVFVRVRAMGQCETKQLGLYLDTQGGEQTRLIRPLAGFVFARGQLSTGDQMAGATWRPL